MSVDKIGLKDEIVTTDPLARGYASMTIAEVLVDLKLVNRPKTVLVTVRGMYNFLLMENTYRVNDGDDTQARSLWQRMLEVDALATTPSAAIANPWGSSSLGDITEIQQIKVGQLVQFITLMSQGGMDIELDLTDSNFISYLAGAQAAGCMSIAQETALLALADTLQDRITELSLGNVKEGHIERARS